MMPNSTGGTTSCTEAPSVTNKVTYMLIGVAAAIFGLEAVYAWYLRT